MERVVHIAKNQEEAREWEIHQYLNMTHEERQQVAKRLKEKVYGVNPPDVKSSGRKLSSS
ncbi:MAG: hypothetical protein U5K69_16535 [Balneolaceae bacterium]|nr:hypothetical protein [Balneolaceae bacterium]